MTTTSETNSVLPGCEQDHLGGFAILLIWQTARRHLLYTGYYSKGLMYAKSFHPHNNSVKWLQTPFYRWGNWGTESVSHVPKSTKLGRGSSWVRADADAYLLGHRVFAVSLGPSLFPLQSNGRQTLIQKKTTLKSWKNRSDAKRNEGEVHGALNLTLTRFPKPRGQLRQECPCLVLASHCCPLERGVQTTRAPHRFTVMSKALQCWSLAGQPPHTAGNTCVSFKVQRFTTILWKEVIFAYRYSMSL